MGPRQGWQPQCDRDVGWCHGQCTGLKVRRRFQCWDRATKHRSDLGHLKARRTAMSSVTGSHFKGHFHPLFAIFQCERAHFPWEAAQPHSDLEEWPPPRCPACPGACQGAPPASL